MGNESGCGARVKRGFCRSSSEGSCARSMGAGMLSWQWRLLIMEVAELLEWSVGLLLLVNANLKKLRFPLLTHLSTALRFHLYGL